MWCVVGLAYNEEVEAQSNYKKSYLWWFGNPASDSNGSNRIEKECVGVTPRISSGRGEERLCDLVCVKHL